MLVLSRKKNETVVIGDNVTVTVLEIRGDKTRLGIVAPQDVRIDREEVRDAVDRGEQQSGRRPAV